MRRLRGVLRLLAAVAHALHGIGIVLAGFHRRPIEQRRERIRWWSRKMLATLGIGLEVRGEPAPGPLLLVANHISWLDMMAIHAVAPQARFVSKAAVRHWPLLSHLADAADTLYLERERKRDALRIIHVMAGALGDGQVVAVFPEGTTSDGRGLLPFHANLLQAAIATGGPVQPVALRFADAHGPVSRSAEYIGDTTLAGSLWRIACGERLVAHVRLLPPRPAAGADRRVLAEQLRADIAGELRAAGVGA